MSDIIQKYEEMQDKLEKAGYERDEYIVVSKTQYTKMMTESMLYEQSLNKEKEE